MPSYALVPNQSSATMKLQGDINVTSSTFLGGSGIIKAAHFVGGTFSGDGQLLTGVSSAGGVEVTDPIYGAVCNGVTDDSNAVQACVTGSAANGKPCIIPPGKICAFGDLSANPHAHLDVPLSAKLSGPGTLLLNTDGGGLCALGANGDIRIAQGNGGIRFENVTFQAGSVPGYSCLLNASTDPAGQIGFLHLIRVSFNGSTGGPFTTGIVLGNVVNSEMVDGGFDGNFMGEVTDVGSFTNVVTVRDVYFEKLLGSATQYYQLQIGHNHGGLNLEISHNTFEVGPNSLNIDGGGQVLNNYMSDPVGGLTGTLITADGNPGFSGGISNNFLASEGGTVQIDGLHLHGNSAVVAGNFMDSQQTTILLTGSGNVVQGNYLYGPPHVQGIHVSTGSYNLIGPNQYFQNGSNPEEVCDSSATFNHIISAVSFQSGNNCIGQGNIVENLPNTSLNGYSSLTLTGSTTYASTPLYIQGPLGGSTHGKYCASIVNGPGGVGSAEQLDLCLNSGNNGPFEFGTYGDSFLRNEFAGNLYFISGFSTAAVVGLGGISTPYGVVSSTGIFKSTLTVQGNAFSVGGSSFTVTGGSATVAYSMTAGSFSGNGSSLTSLTAANISAGSLGAQVIASSLAVNGVTAATYGSGTSVAQIAVGGDGRITSASNVSIGTIGVPAGGTGDTSLTAHGVVIGEGTSNLASLPAMANGGLVIGSGTGVDPATGTIAGNAAVTVTNGGGTITLSLNSSSATLQGNAFNGASQLVQLNGSTQYPALSGALITSVAQANVTGLLAQFSSVGTSTSSLQTQITTEVNAVGVSTNAIATSTISLQSQIDNFNTVGGSLTVKGNAFSVGGSSFTVTGGSATVAYQLTAGSINLTGPVGNITSQSSVTASEFFGSGAGLTGISGGVSGLTPGAVTYGATSTTLASGPANMTASSTTFTGSVLIATAALTISAGSTITIQGAFNGWYRCASTDVVTVATVTFNLASCLLPGEVNASSISWRTVLRGSASAVATRLLATFNNHYIATGVSSGGSAWQGGGGGAVGNSTSGKLCALSNDGSSSNAGTHLDGQFDFNTSADGNINQVNISNEVLAYISGTTGNEMDARISCRFPDSVALTSVQIITSGVASTSNPTYNATLSGHYELWRTGEKHQ